MNRVLRVLRRPVVIAAMVIVLLAVAAGLFWFQPWKLWVDDTVQEDLPAAVASDTSAPADAPAASRSPAGPRTLATGKLISQEHATSGTVRILQGADGFRVLRLEGLDTSNGPDLHVWITDAPVERDKDGWHVFDDGAYENLGELKGNKGSQNYRLPPDIDLARYKSVSIWCDRFDVSFGAAEITRT
ncbi:DM13 domain-containing protein [Streptomyces sp. NPDC004647]|uniref:DM13 domain-containing protein n=1 Tax=Streptomyces sp. NPDC004647 TaxID=3154671 RepID=UPI0033A02671